MDTVSFCAMSIPKCEGGAKKESHESNVEACAFGPIPHELRQDAFAEHPYNRHRDRVDARHPNREQRFARCYQNREHDRCNDDEQQQGRICDDQNLFMAFNGCDFSST